VVTRTHDWQNAPEGLVYAQIWKFNLATGKTQYVTTDGDLDSGTPTISDDGTVIGFTSAARNLVAHYDNEYLEDTYLWRQDAGLETGHLTRLPIWTVDYGSYGRELLLSDDGRTLTLTTPDRVLASDTENGYSDVYQWAFTSLG
jgi:hypothetical protein